MKKNMENVVILALLLGGLLAFTTAASVLDTTLASNKSEPSMRLALFPSRLEVNETVHAKGWLTSSSPISDAIIKLRIILPNATIAYPDQGSSIETDGTGAFSIDFTPTVPGKYNLTASFEGGPDYRKVSVSAAFIVMGPTESESSMKLNLASSGIEIKEIIHEEGS